MPQFASNEPIIKAAAVTDDFVREKRIKIAQLYGHFRATRKLTQWAISLRGPDSSLAREARIAEQDAWNSLKIMKALIWLDEERSEEHASELPSLMRSSSDVFG